jgi:aspartate/methionine/tyrosine aminotransferase
VQFSVNVAQLEPSATLALAARARQLKAEGVPVVDLSAGEPKFPAPGFAMRAAMDAIAAGRTGYPPTPGLPELREAVSQYLEETTSRGPIDPTGVLVGAGVKQALFNCSYALFGPGDEVQIPAPYWPSYTAIVQLAGATPVIVDSTWNDGFLVDVDQLEAARTDRTRGLFLNSPGNPTGAVYDTTTLTAILEWADRHGIWVLSDEIYRRLGYVDAVPSVFDVDGVPERVVLLDGISKAFCMPGFRIGYAVGPHELIKKASDLQGQTTSGAVGPSQMAAAAALGRTEEREAFLADLVGKLTLRREQGLAGLQKIEALEVRPPDGSIYFYARLVDDSRTSMDVAEALLRDHAVASVPGEPFGSPGYLRFNFAVERETLDEGIRRIGDFFAS